MADNILIATETVLTNFEGREVYLIAGQTTVRAGHPLLEGREGMFTPIQVSYDLGDDVPGKTIPAEPEPEPEPEPVEDGLPKGNASREEWAAYAVAHDVPADEVEGLTRDEIRDRFTPPG